MTSRRIMVIASGGGHWTQMLRLREAFSGFDVFYVGVKDMYRDDVHPAPFFAVPDVSRLHRWNIFKTFFGLLFIIVRHRPAAIVTTGSLPGMLALRIGKLFGAKTMWIDSVANVEEVSMSGRKAGKNADVWLTQWEHLASPSGPTYRGSVL